MQLDREVVIKKKIKFQCGIFAYCFLFSSSSKVDKTRSGVLKTPQEGSAPLSAAPAAPVRVPSVSACSTTDSGAAAAAHGSGTPCPQCGEQAGHSPKSARLGCWLQTKE